VHRRQHLGGDAARDEVERLGIDPPEPGDDLRGDLADERRQLFPARRGAAEGDCSALTPRVETRSMRISRACARSAASGVSSAPSSSW